MGAAIEVAAAKFSPKEKADGAAADVEAGGAAPKFNVGTDVETGFPPDPNESVGVDVAGVPNAKPPAVAPGWGATAVPNEAPVAPKVVDESDGGATAAGVGTAAAGVAPKEKPGLAKTNKLVIQGLAQGHS